MEAIHLLGYLSWANIALFGWLIAIVLWAITFVLIFRPKTNIRQVAIELYWIVEQIDEISQGSIKGEDKWIIYRNLLLLVARVVGHFAQEHVEAIGKDVVADLSSKSKEVDKV